jgi:prepilin-type N-terminal cleavage/methylation domain-containing protein
MKNNQKTGNQNPRVEGKPDVAAFTLIELLTVISIIAILAAFIIPIMSTLKRREYVSKTQAEMAQIETAIESYKAAYGFYPPSGTNVLINQLYYELVGTMNTNNGGPQYTTLDGRSIIPAVNVNNYFGVNGLLNCTKSGAGEDAPVAKTFLPDLKSSQIGQYTNVPPSKFVTGMSLLVASLGGPYQKYEPLGGPAAGPGINPWRYNSSSPTNNPGSYDLYVQLVIKPGQTNLVCNWTKQIQVNSLLP